MSYTDNYPYFPLFLSGPYGPIPYGWSTCGGRPFRSSMPPSPTAPWDRDSVTPLTETLVAAGVINLNVATSFLSQTLNTPPAPVAATIPNGNFVNQTHLIYIRSDQIQTTETWLLAGTFAGGFGHLRFNTIGWSAVLQWDGAGWVLQAGNAELIA